MPLRLRSLVLRAVALALLGALLVAPGAGVVTAADPDYGIALKPASASLAAGDAVVLTVEIASLGLDGEVTLAAYGLPTAATATFGANAVQIGESTTLKLATTAATPRGTFSIQVRATFVPEDKTAKPIVHSATLSLAVSGNAIDRNSALAFAPLRATWKGLWKKPLPVACPAALCVADYTALGLTKGPNRAILRDRATNLDQEFVRIYLPGDLACDGDGVAFDGHAFGEAFGPIAGPASLDERATIKLTIGPASWLHPFVRQVSIWYEIDAVAGATGTLTGLIQGEIVTGGCLDGTFLGGAGDNIRYDVSGTSFADTGHVSLVVPGPFFPGSLDISFHSIAAEGLPGDATLPPPTPICPIGGC
jgi:hypothetical protein